MAIGESVIAVGIAASGLAVDAQLVAVAILGLALSACLWWSYFGSSEGGASIFLLGDPALRGGGCISQRFRFDCWRCCQASICASSPTGRAGPGAQGEHRGHCRSGRFGCRSRVPALAGDAQPAQRQALCRRRILFPFTGAALSERVLDAALRVAVAEGATLVPAYLARVPRQLPLDTALPRQCDVALPVLEAIEQKASRLGVQVDSRISPGRTNRHALEELIRREPAFDRILVAAATEKVDGFSGEEIGWLLGNLPGEIIVIRPGGGQMRSAHEVSDEGHLEIRVPGSRSVA